MKGRADSIFCRLRASHRHMLRKAHSDHMGLRRDIRKKASDFLYPVFSTFGLDMLFHRGICK